MPVKAKFHKTLLEHVLGTQYWALRPPRTTHQEYTIFLFGGSKKERAQQFVNEAASLMLQILQTTTCEADLSAVTTGDFRELLEAYETDISYTPVQQIQAHKHLIDPKGDRYNRHNS